MAEVQVGSPERLNRLLMALTIALSWLTLAALPETGAVPKGFHAAVSQRGRASVISLALALLDELGNLPQSCLLNQRPVVSGYASVPFPVRSMLREIQYLELKGTRSFRLEQKESRKITW